MLKAAQLKNSGNIAPGYKITRENNSIFSAKSLMQRKYCTTLFTETALFLALSAVMDGSIYVTLFAIFLKS